MSRRLLPLLPLLALVAAACGGGSSPAAPSTPAPPPPGTPVSGVVFYDENANGVLDATEEVRLPGITVAIGGRTGQSGASGRFTVDGVQSGAQPATLRSETLPAYFSAGASISVTAPQSGGEVAVPAVLALGARNRPNVYLAFGDSITWGSGSSNGGGYRDWFASGMKAYWGKAAIINAGIPGTKTDQGRARLPGTIATYRPSHVLILYGTNDWNEAECRNDFPCYTIDELRAMVQDTRDGGALPVVGTIPPVNPAYVDRAAEERNDWVRRMNERVRAMAKAERAPIAEVHGDFLKQPSLPALFADDKHPNEEGYRVMAQSFQDAVTKPLAGSAAAAGPPVLLEP